MNESDFKAAAVRVAANSPCNKRKVGAIIVTNDDEIIASGYNHANCGPCEDAAGATLSTVVHAEIAALNDMRDFLDNNSIEYDTSTFTMYVTQPPCNSCLAAIKSACIERVVIADTFMKFDGDKLRYDLVPVDWSRGDAEILTFGARKYKPNNWRDVDDIGRYISALERHLEAVKSFIEGEPNSSLFDSDSGLHHMKHLRTNAGFLLTILADEDKAKVFINRPKS